MTKRKSHYAPRIAETICLHIAMGETLEDALVKVGVIAPTLKTVWTWLDTHPEFAERMDRARQMQGDMNADKMLKMSETVLANPSKAAAIRVAADILKWQAEIRNPKKYGSKVQHELTKPPLSPAELRAEIQNLQRELGVVAVPGMNTAPVFTRKTEEELVAAGKSDPAQIDPRNPTQPKSESHGDAHTFFDPPEAVQ